MKYPTNVQGYDEWEVRQAAAHAQGFVEATAVLNKDLSDEVRMGLLRETEKLRKAFGFKPGPWQAEIDAILEDK